MSDRGASPNRYCMYVRRMICASALMAASLAAAQPTRLAIGEALAAAAANQPLILQACAGAEAAREREALARSAYLPNLSASASYTRVEPQNGMELDFRPYLNVDIKSPTTTEDLMNFRLGASEVVFDFGQRDAQVRLAEAGADLAAIGVDQAGTEIAYCTARTFYASLFLRAELKVLEEQLSTLGKHLDDAAMREETGSSTHYDVLATHVRIAAVKKQLIEARGQYAKQIIDLEGLTGVSGDIEPVGDFEPGSSIVDPGSAVSEAIAARNEVRQALATERQAQIGLEAARLGNKPTLAAQAQIGYKNGIKTYDKPDIDELMFNWSLGLSLNVPIYDGRQTEHRAAEAHAKSEAARQDVEVHRRSIRAQALQALEDLASSRDQTANSLAQVSQAQEALNIAEIQYEVGAITNLQYLDAQTSFELAKLTNLGAVYGEVMSGLALSQSLGRALK
jgi:outer membrane protein